MIELPPSRPAASYNEALDRARALMALDDAEVLPTARTSLIEAGERRPWCVVLLHGLTNNPGQFAQFARMLQQTGANVFIPRMPKHGYADRLTDALASLTAEELVAMTNGAIDIACGLGENVAVLGISAGALLTAYFAQHRSDIAHALPVAPDFSLLHLPYGITRLLEKVLLTLPNRFLWWDPRIREAQRPKTAYPRFATHGLMQTVRIGDDVYAAAKVEAPRAKRITTIVNPNDPAVNNAVTLKVVDAWRRRRSEGIDYI